VTREELLAVKAPAPTASWFPLTQGQILQRVEEQLVAAGFTPTGARYALSRGDHRFFGVIDTQSALGSGITLAIGVRNSTDKSMPLGFIAGHHVRGCSNRAFRSEILVIRKHTKHGELRFAEAMAKAIQRLSQFQEEETLRMRRLQETLLVPECRDSLILEAFHQGIISARQLPAVIYQSRTPEIDYGSDVNSASTLMQAFTWILQDVLKSNPQRFAAATMRLQHLLDTRLLGSHPAGAEECLVPSQDATPGTAAHPEEFADGEETAEGGGERPCPRGGAAERTR